MQRPSIDKSAATHHFHSSPLPTLRAPSTRVVADRVRLRQRVENIALKLDSLVPVDVAEFAPHKFPLLHRCPVKLTNPQGNARQEKHELVLDADDLAVALVPENGTALVHLPTALSGVMLGAAIGLSGYFALYAALKEIHDASRILTRLQQERLIITQFMPKSPYANPWDRAQIRTAEAMLLLNRRDRWEQRTRAVFSGGVVSAGALPEIFGYLVQPQLLGSALPKLVAAGGVALTVSVPLITLFAAANAALQTHRFIRAHRDERYVKMLALQSPWNPDVFDVKDHVHKRLRLVQRQAAVTALGFTGIAIGAPLTFFGGGYGVALLVPGIIIVAVANHFESKNIEYQNPMSLEEEFALVTERQIINAMGFAQLEYCALKAAKSAKRADYLPGAHRAVVLRICAAPLRQVARMRGRAEHSGDSPRELLYKFFGERLKILASFWQHEIDVYEKHYQACDGEVRGLLARAKFEKRRCRMQAKALQQEMAQGAALPRDRATRRLLIFLVESNLYREFVKRWATSSDVRKWLNISTDSASAVHPDDILAAVSSEAGEEICRDLYAKVELLVLTVFKAWRRSRAAELADLSIDRKRAKFKYHKDGRSLAGPLSHGPFD